MTSFEKQFVSELSEKYVFETFDFKNKSPEDLLASYQETFNKMSKVLSDREKSQNIKSNF